MRRAGAVRVNVWRSIVLSGALLTSLTCSPSRPNTSAGAERVVPATRLTSEEWKDLEFTILEDYDKGDALEDIERDFLLFRELGITTWRGSFGWDDYQPAPDSMDLEWLHGFIELARRHGIRLRPYLAYTPEWAAAKRGTEVWNDPPRDLEQWEEFAAAMASALSRHPNVLSYEIYNEENVSLWWDGTAEEFAEVVRRGAAAIDTSDRDAQVIAGGMVWPDAEWMEAVCEDPQNDQRLDAIAFHAYPETWTPDSVTVENYLAGYADEFLPAVDAACGRKPVWINELGYATAGGKTERQQASWWVRAIATFASAPRVTQLGVYEIKDLPASDEVIGDAENHHLGLTRIDREPKLAFHTVRLLAHLLGGRTAVVLDGVDVTTSSEEVHVRLFRREDGHRVLIAWVPPGARSARVRLTLRQPGMAASENAHDGSSSPIEEFDGKTLELSLQPDQPRIIEIAVAR